MLTLLLATVGVNCMQRPYASQQLVEARLTQRDEADNPDASFVLSVFTTWGTELAMPVKVASTPTASTTGTWHRTTILLLHLHGCCLIWYGLTVSMFAVHSEQKSCALIACRHDPLLACSSGAWCGCWGPDVFLGTHQGVSGTGV